MMQRAKAVANAAIAAARQLMSSGSKAMRPNKNQGSDAMAQQGDASMAANAQSANASDNGNSGANVMQEHGNVEPNAWMLLDSESQTPRFVANTTSRSSPSDGSQTATPASGAATLASNVVPSGINPSTPPRLNASGISGVTDAGADPLDVQGTNTGIGESHVPSPSPRRNTQSLKMHQLQQTLRNSATETVAHSDSSSDSGNCGPFDSLLANDTSAFVETVQEGGSGDDGEWPEGTWPDDNSDPACDPSLTHDSGSQELIINAKDPGCANFAMNIGALGNASGTPMDGAQNMSFGESAVDGGNTDKGNEGVASSDNLDLSDPGVMAATLTQHPVANPHSPTAIQFDQQAVATNHSPEHSPKQTLGTAASVLTGNSDGTSAAEPTQDDPTLSQGNPSQSNPPSLQPDGDDNISSEPNSNNSDGNGGDQGGSSVNNGPQGPDPSRGGLHELVFACQTMGGPLQNWGIDGAIQVAEVVWFAPVVNSPVPNQLALGNVRSLVQPDVVDWVTDHAHFNNQHNDEPRVRAIINGMDMHVVWMCTCLQHRMHQLLWMILLCWKMMCDHPKNCATCSLVIFCARRLHHRIDFHGKCLLSCMPGGCKLIHTQSLDRSGM